MQVSLGLSRFCEQVFLKNWRLKAKLMRTVTWPILHYKDRDTLIEQSPYYELI